MLTKMLDTVLLLKISELAVDNKKGTRSSEPPENCICSTVFDLNK